jgi:IS5 family transposase
MRSATAPGTSRSSASRPCPKCCGTWRSRRSGALSQLRAWVEHLFHIVKNLFRQKKMRYRGLAKNTGKLHTLFALANVVIVKQTLLAQART